MKVSGVYIITNTNNFKVYIGSSHDIRYRWSRHKRDVNDNVHHSLALQRAWDKYGEDTFDFNVIELCSIDSLINKNSFG